jgi:hypothetical protein
MMRALITNTLFVLSILLSAQALAFDVGGLSYDIINTTDVEVTGRASGNTATNIVIPATVVGSGTTYSVTTIGGQAFVRDYPPFNEQAIPALTSVIIPDSVTSIGDNAFAFEALTSTIIPDSVETIGFGAFANNDLTSVIIPDSVTSIGHGAFVNNAFTSAAFEGNFGNFNLDIFFLNPDLATITYCEGTTGWPQGFNNFSTIIVTEPVDCSTAPDAPLITGIVPGNEQVSISVSVANDGGSPITGYNAYCFGDRLLFGASPTSPIAVSGLTNGEAYTCAVTATNDIGDSPASAFSEPVTPVAPAPGC